jgi:glycerol-3-phosphate dehydrogenase (NAD(P)+)
MAEERANRRYLPGFPFPDALQIELKLEQALDQADLALVVVPTAGFRQVVRQIAELGAKMPLVWACKGFEAGTAKLPHQVVAEELGGKAQSGALSGPSFAQEVAKGLPTALTLASRDEPFAHAMALELHSPRLRVYSSPDVVGVEIGSAVKNVMAIAAGISDGMGYGYNARAALITRGLAEIGRLGVAMGGRPETFMGLTGAGDLILTCTGDLSRNRTVGLRLAQGKALDTILAELGHIAEGVHSAREVLRLAASMNVEMPITHAVCQVLFEGMPPGKAVEGLLNREPKAEN